MTPAVAPAAAAVVAEPGRPAAGRPGTGGMLVGIDPQTGEIGMPTPEQTAELLEGADARAWSFEGLEVVQHPDGRKSVDLQGRFMSYSVVRIGAGGEVQMDCVEGERAAQAAVRAPGGGAVAATPEVRP